jgi:arginase
LVQTTDTVVLGPRDRDELAAAGVSSIAADVPFYDDVALRRVDLRETVRSHTRHLQRNTGHWWFHLDLDVLATAALPAVRYPQPGGLEWAELEIVAEITLATANLVGWNIAIYNPELDPGDAGAARIVTLLDALVDRIA